MGMRGTCPVLRAVLCSSSVMTRLAHFTEANMAILRDTRGGASNGSAFPGRAGERGKAKRRKIGREGDFLSELPLHSRHAVFILDKNVPLTCLILWHEPHKTLRMRNWRCCRSSGTRAAKRSAN